MFHFCGVRPLPGLRLSALPFPPPAVFANVLNISFLRILLATKQAQGNVVKF